MAHIKRFGLALTILLAGSACAIFAQAPAHEPANANHSEAIPASRLAGDWGAGTLAQLPSSKAKMPPPATDLGIVAAGTRVDRALLLLEPSSAQRQALDIELQDQQTPGSSRYHRWLTPSTFASTYANSSSDVAAIVDWLASQGFQVAPLPEGRGWIEFSGNASQIEQAFHTHLHSALTSSGTRIVIVGSISVPAAFFPLVHGLVSFDGSLSAPSLTTPKPIAAIAPSLAAATSIQRAEALTPQLAAQLLHFDALHEAGSQGKGEFIAIAARSNVRPQDIAAFRSTFKLLSNPLAVVLEGTDPGMTADQAEATLTASWAGAVAPKAQIVLVPAASTSATDGVDLSLAAIIDHSLAHAVVVGYATCEPALSESHQAFYSALYRQAAAQGISVIAAAGDSGSAACQSSGADAPITTGYNVNALASTPWDTAVGAAAFDGAAPSGSSSSLIAWSPRNPADPAYAGGGGRSAFYHSPSWQPLPSQFSSTAGTSARMLPDITLPTALDTGVNRGVAFCLSGATASEGCNLVRSGGSSAAAAVFAGLAALISEKNGAQGNLSPNLYALSRQPEVFDDITQGSTNLTCAAGSLGCDASGQIGYAASPGYDLATGLGSVNAQELVNLWASPQATGTAAATVDLAITPKVANDTYNPTAQITLTATVISSTGGATPTGTVFFFDKATSQNLSGTPSAVGANGVATLTVTTGLANGGNNVTAGYSGDTTYAAATSAPITVTAEPSTTSLAVVLSSTTPAAGATITVKTTLAVGIPGIGTVPPGGKVTLNLDGKPTATTTLATDTTGATTATFSATIPSAGVHTLQTIYAGDANYTATTSPAVTINATKGATVTALVATPATLTPGIPETLTVTVAPANAAAGTTYSLTGTVSFYDGTTLLGTAVVNANAASLPTVTLAGATLHNITAVYSGDTSWAASTSNALALQAVLLPDSITLAVNINTTGPGQVINLVATVTPAAVPALNAEQNPTGNVIFYNGATILAAVALMPSLNFTSTATLVTGALPGGQNVLTAMYVGDLFYSPATSNPVTIDVQDFSITPSGTNSPTNLKIIKGSSGSASYTVTGLGGFNGQIQLVCAVPTQDDMTCTPSPQQITPSGTVTFTVQTFASGGTTVANHAPSTLWPRISGGTALAGLLFFLLPIGSKARLFTSSRSRNFVVLLLLLAGVGAAGIGCSSSVKLASNSGTPLGVATLTITAAAYVDNTVVSHSVYLTVNVLPPGASLNSQPRRNSK